MLMVIEPAAAGVATTSDENESQTRLFRDEAPLSSSRTFRIIHRELMPTIDGAVVRRMGNIEQQTVWSDGETLGSYHEAEETHLPCVNKTRGPGVLIHDTGT